MKLFVGHPNAPAQLLDPRVPLMSGVVQNQDAYMKGKIAQRRYYDRVLPALKSCWTNSTPSPAGAMDCYAVSAGRCRIRDCRIGLHD